MDKRIFLFAFVFVILLSSVGSALFYCYQETANISSSCGVNLTSGKYGFETITSAGWDNISSLYDGDWNTYSMPITDTNGQAWMYINYSKVVNGIDGNIWQVAYLNNLGTARIIENITIPSNVYNTYNNTIVLRIRSEIVLGGVEVKFDGDAGGAFTNLVTRFSSASWDNKRIYEEALIYNIYQYSVEYNSSVYSESSQDFKFLTNINIPPNTISNATLFYNGVGYSATWSIDGSNITIDRSIQVPSVTNLTVFPFYWQMVVSNGTVNTTYYSANYTQSVYVLEVGSCNIFDTPIFIIDSLNDEGTNTPVNVSVNPLINIYLEITGKGDSSNFFTTYQTVTSNFTNVSVCMNSSLLNISDYRIDAVLSYKTDDHVEEFWYIDNGTITLSSNKLDSYTTKNITLRDLLLTDSKTFKFTYYDENYNTKAGSIVTVLRRYIGSTGFLEVERCKLDPNGDCHIHLVEEDVIYMFRITTNGNLEYVSDEYNAKCLETPCVITLQKSSDVSSVIDGTYDNLAEGTYSLTSDKNTRTVTLDYNLESTGTMELAVYEFTNNATDPLVSSTSQTAKAGTISVSVPVSYENKTYYAVVYHDTGFVTSQWVDLSENGYSYFGNLGLLFAMILVLTLALIGISSGGWTIVFVLIGVLFAMSTTLINMDYYLYIYIVIAGILILWKLSSRRSA